MIARFVLIAALAGIFACGGAEVVEEPIVVDEPAVDPDFVAVVEEPEPQPVTAAAETPDELVRRPDELILEASASVDARAVGALEVREGVAVLQLHQRACRIDEVEPDALFEAASADECRRLNLQQFAERRQVVLRVPSGEVVIQVTNVDVPYALGFWLREEGDPMSTLLSAGGIAEGATLELTTFLEPGRYTYSCPLNPTPDYTLVVE